MSRAREPPTPPDDSTVPDTVALILAASRDWGGDELAAIADAIATVRPTPVTTAPPHIPGGDAPPQP